MASARHLPKPAAGGTIRRCAIYTRKSSEEGLEQAFNSLDAQREACEAYARSQRHEGWTVSATQYDDGGLSGGTLERPALQRLLADIGAGKVDLILVYKVDRLTRSLPDFAKIVDVLDAHGASFVSVTQHFNTATSMGRLTLNMLLSFAQFEREVAGERIRDKIAASKRKGMWMGGNLPLGYNVRERKLVVNEAEAEVVRSIYNRYLALGSVRRLREQIEAQGVLSKSGSVLTRGALFHLLQNRIYKGEIAHKGNFYPGEHAALIDADLWQQVQERLADNRSDWRVGARARSPSLLAGLLVDGAGQPMTATHATKGGERYRYYVSRDLIAGTRSTSAEGMRLPAAEIERIVIDLLLQLLSDQSALLSALREAGALPASAAEQHALLKQAAQFAGGWSALGANEQRALLRALIRRVEVGPNAVRLHVVLTNLSEAMLGRSPPEPPVDAAALVVAVPAALRRTGKEMALVVGTDTSCVDPALVRLIAKARRLRESLVTEPNESLSAIAQREGFSRTYATQLLKLTWLAPVLVEAILAGRQPAGLTVTRLMKGHDLPLGWTAQRDTLAFT